jgi:hypothetical protein
LAVWALDGVQAVLGDVSADSISLDDELVVWVYDK